MYRSNIPNLINSYRIIDDSPINVLSQGSIYCKSGKWFIPKDIYPKFLELISYEINNFSNYQFHYLELPHNEYNYIKIDLDLRFDANEEEKKDNSKIIRRYDDTFIKIFVSELAKILSNIIEINKDTDTKIYIQEKKKPKFISKENKIKDGIHIVIPGIVMDNCVLNYLRDELVKSDIIINSLSNIENTSTVENVIDQRIIQNNAWYIYGCGKPEDKQDYYKVSRIVQIINKGNKFNAVIAKDIVDQVSTLDYIYLFSNFNKNINIKYRDDINLDELKKKYNDNSNNLTISKSSCLTSLEKKKIMINYINIVNKNRRQSSLAELEISSLLSCLKINRADDFKDWWNIGLSLYNMDNRNFEIWNKWSSKSSKYNSDECYRRWHVEFPKCGKYCMGLNTIRNYALQDNKERFKEITNANMNKFLNDWVIEHIQEDFIRGISINTFSNNVQKYIKDYASFKIICADPSGHSSWFKYKNNRWSEDKAANEVYLTLANELKEKFYDLRKILKRKSDQIDSDTQEINRKVNKRRNYDNDEYFNSDQSDNETDKDSRNGTLDNMERFKKQQELENNQTIVTKCMTKCNEIIAFLSGSNKEKVIKDLAHKCYDEEFFKNLNENRDVFICNNGVLDLEECVFRKGESSDMSTMTSNIEFPIENMDSDYDSAGNEIMTQIQDYLDKIFPDNDVQDYILNNIAEKLSGRIRREIFIICTGSGANGKSQFFKLIQKTFGDYYGSFDNSLLNTPKKDANSASPAIASLKGIRLAFTTEPKNGQPFETDKLKELIGGDELVGRHLRQDLIRFVPQYLMGMMCNDIPEMPSTDDGVWRKVFVIPFESKFIIKQEEMFKLKDNKNYPNHFQAQVQEHLYPIWAPYLLKMLFDRYNILHKLDFKYPVPDKVKMATKKYQMESNLFSQFFNERIVPQPGYQMSFMEVFTCFNDFVKGGNFDHKINKKTFIIQMERFLGKLNKNKCYDGFILSTDIEKNEDEEQNEEENNNDNIQKNPKLNDIQLITNNH